MRVSGFWSAVGLIVTGLIVADLVLHPVGTSTAFNGVTSLSKNTGNQLIGKAA
ncbi:MAG: hypothetical protein ACYC56_14735 [Candidatus Aquicultor sp.]